jgi:hypothetical protein
MNMPRRALLQALALGVVAGWLTTAGAADDKVSATGTWKATITTDDGKTFDVTYKLKQQGEKLTGTVTDREGKEHEIKNGTVKGGEVSFDVTHEHDGQELTVHHKGKLTADSITGKIEFEVDGEKHTLEWKATAQKSDK